jgi:hypothetical protein
LYKFFEVTASKSQVQLDEKRFNVTILPFEYKLIEKKENIGPQLKDVCDCSATI